MYIDDSVKELKEETIKIRKDIHKNPELGFEEFRTSKLVSDYLENLGYEVKTVAKTGVVALLRAGDQSKTVAIRADIDCLPLQELNDVEYVSQVKGKMHACGHDGHTAIALTVAKILKQRQAELKGNVKFLFQPAEESPGGALPMIEEGVLENPKVNAIFALHLWNSSELGNVVVKKGPLMASADEFKITIKGKGGHAALPHQTIDSIVVASQVINALQAIISRNVNPLESAVLTIGKIEGGSNFNIIAEKTTMLGTIRTFNSELRHHLEHRVEEVVKSVTSAFGATYEYDFDKLYPPTINDEKMTELVKKAAEKVVGIENINETEMNMGAEDMSYFLQKVSGCYFLLGSANKAKGLDKPHHSPYFNFDEDALSIGTQIIVDSVFNYFETV